MGVSFAEGEDRMKKSLGPQPFSFTNPAWVVGTYDPQGKPNVMTAALGGTCCMSPPCVYVSLRKATYTYGNIVQRQAYTVSLPSASHVRETDYFGIASGRDTDKFAATGLTPVRSDVVDAPYVAEFPVALECALIRTIDLGLHTQFIGEVKDVKVDEAFVDAAGDVDFLGAGPVVCCAGSYHAIGKALGGTFVIGKELG